MNESASLAHERCFLPKTPLPLWLLPPYLEHKTQPTETLLVQICVQVRQQLIKVRLRDYPCCQQEGPDALRIHRYFLKKHLMSWHTGRDLNRVGSVADIPIACLPHPVAKHWRDPQAAALVGTHLMAGLPIEFLKDRCYFLHRGRNKGVPRRLQCLAGLRHQRLKSQAIGHWQFALGPAERSAWAREWVQRPRQGCVIEREQVPRNEGDVDQIKGGMREGKLVDVGHSMLEEDRFLYSLLRRLLRCPLKHVLTEIGPGNPASLDRGGMARSFLIAIAIAAMNRRAEAMADSLHPALSR